MKTEKKYLRFSEYNEWEGETWYFYIQNDISIKYLKNRLAKIHYQSAGSPMAMAMYFDKGYNIDNMPKRTVYPFKIDDNNGTYYDPNVVSALCKKSKQGYMQYHSILNGKLDIKKLKKIKSNTKLSEKLYKGGIKNFVK